MRRIRVTGDVPLESWPFRAFLSPGARMNLKKLRLGIDFEMEAHDGRPLDENHPTLRAMKESARQLGLDLEVEDEVSGCRSGSTSTVPASSSTPSCWRSRSAPAWGKIWAIHKEVRCHD